MVLESAGADKAVLLMPQKQDWFVEAVAVVDQPIKVEAIAFSNSSDLPHSLVNTVKRNLQHVVITDMQNYPLFATDSYMKIQQPKSLLCTPIQHQGKLVAILYLENRVTTDAFTRDCIELLNILCTQAAISLENARLYQQAQIYAQQLEQSQLQIVQSEKMASLGNLVAGVAHEINNPIGFLNGSINNAKDYTKDLLEHLELYQQQYPNPTTPIQDNAEDIDLEYLCEDLPKILDSMQGATNRITNISTSLRTFSRADTEYKVSANLHEGLDSTILILKYRLKASEHRPAIEIIHQYGELPIIKCFPGQLNQVFMNILANGIDMFDEMAQTQSYEQLKTNPQKITICTQKNGDNGNEILISIRDNGKGMDEATQARIFDHLFTTKAVGKGTGLGLAIARQIVVEKHCGRLEVKSQVGIGTEFCIYLPIGDESKIASSNFSESDTTGIT
jgi:signal transduction histidine kinase